MNQAAAKYAAACAMNLIEYYGIKPPHSTQRLAQWLCHCLCINDLAEVGLEACSSDKSAIDVGLGKKLSSIACIH